MQGDMMRTRVFFATVAWFMLAALATAAQPDYFPLLEGNQWIYQQTGAAPGDPITVVVDGRRVIGDRTYFEVRGFPEGPALLRLDQDGTLFAYDPKEEREQVWVRFGAPESTSYPTAIDSCSPTAVIESRNATFQGAVGTFSSALHINYPPGTCADAGILSDYYLPYVGLLRRTVQSFAGPRTYELIYARLGGVTFVSEPSLSFSLAVNPATAVVSGLPNGKPPVARVRMTLRNHFLPPIGLEFPSGQKFDVTLTNEDGEEVYRWSDGKAFTLALVHTELRHGERNWTVQVPLVDRSGTPLPAGYYQLKAWLTNTGPRRFEAAVGLQIVAAP